MLRIDKNYQQHLRCDVSEGLLKGEVLNIHRNQIHPDSHIVLRITGVHLVESVQN